MAVFKAINSKANSKTALGAVLRYVMQDEKIDHDLDLITGVGLFEHPNESLNPKTVLQEYMLTKEAFHKSTGRFYGHFVISYAPDEFTPKTAMAAHNISCEMAEKLFQHHQAVITTHIDKENHIHSHVIVNTVSYLTGQKLHTSKKDLEKMKETCNTICASHGLSIPEKGKSHAGEPREDITVWDKNKYQTLANGRQGKIQSYLIAAMQAVDTSLNYATSKLQFIQEMNKRKYEVLWEEGRKNVLLTDKDGHRIRTSNLAKTFNVSISTKEEIIDEMARRTVARKATRSRRR